MLGFGLGLSHAALYGGGTLEAQVAAIGADAMYVPGDLTSLFTDRKGNSGAAVNGVVGLMLDKSQMGGTTAASYIAGLTDIVTNGGFDTDANWTKGTGWTISGGVANAVVTGFTNISQALALTNNAYYQVDYDVSLTSGQVRGFLGNSGNGQAELQTIIASGSYSSIIKCDPAQTKQIVFRGNPDFTGSIDNIVVRQIPGNHLIPASDAARAILRQGGGLNYLEPDGVDDWYPTNPLLNLGETWWHVGGWRSDTTGRKLFATSDNAGGAFNHASSKGQWTNSSSALATLVNTDPAAVFIATIEQTVTGAIAGRANGAGDLTITPFDDSAAAQGLALFTDINGSFANGMLGRMYAGAFGTGTITASERATIEAWVAEQCGVTI